MITDDELAQLPEDPELAFVEFERIVRARLREEEEKLAAEQHGSIDTYQREYMNKVLAAAKEYDINELSGWTVPAGDNQFDAAYWQFASDVDHLTMRFRIRYAPRNRKNSVVLDGNTKAKIHHYIEQIRTAIEGADLPDPKRDALYDKLNRFSLEVDRNRTSLQAGMAVYIAVCDGIGQGFQKLEPARKLFESIGALLGRAKEVEDSLRSALPAPDERKRLEPPAKQQPAPPDLDDEIPF